MRMQMIMDQTLSVTPALIGMMQVLQMSSAELSVWLRDQALENPLLELPESADPIELSEKKEWINSLSSAGDPDDREGTAEYEPADPASKSLREHLLGQLTALNLSEKVGKAAAYMVELIDEDGRLVESPRELCELIGQSPAVIDAALAQLKTLDPPGIAAADLPECLLLQLQEQGRTSPLLQRILSDHLQDLADGHYTRIAKELEAAESDVRSACEQIRRLDPRPGRQFSYSAQTEFAIPDVLVEVREGSVRLSAPDDHFPTIRLSDTYLELLNTTQDPQLRRYLRQKLSQVDQIRQNLETRKQNTIRCAEVIIRHQEGFFQTGAPLRPLTLADVAAELELNVSTVSRTIREKYIQLQQGLYPFSYFFSQNVGKQGHSADEIKQVLSELVAKEAAECPLSDRRIAEELLSRGIEVSRRTIAKYRRELSIGNQSQRKTSQPLSANHDAPASKSLE